jgi:hypothetical protein
MTARLAEISPRLRCLLLMLSSDRDGEVVAAARAIDRVLQSNKLDWHDLVKAICLPAPAVHHRNDGEWRDWRDLLAFCTSHMKRLSSREREFLRSIARWRGDLTEKQAAWLTAIFERVRREAA